MGEGQAIAEFLIAHHIVREVAAMTAVRTTEQEGHLTMLLYLYDETAAAPSSSSRANFCRPADSLPAS